MFIYRLTNLKYKNDILSGIGAEKTGGRWNAKGTRAVYCSENISLALLEYYIHSENIATLPRNIAVGKIYIPDNFHINELENLPDFWNKYPYTSKTSDIFTALAVDRNFFALKVPSSIVPLEHNFILNPLYKNFGQVEVVEYFELPIDERLKAGKR